jgi:cation transport ATPase
MIVESHTDILQMNKAPIQAFADKASSIFAPVVLIVAAITFFCWMYVPT